MTRLYGVRLPHRKIYDIREAHVGWYWLALIATGAVLYWWR